LIILFFKKFGFYKGFFKSDVRPKARQRLFPLSNCPQYAILSAGSAYAVYSHGRLAFGKSDA
ncbi:MAG: hypothetical protein K2J14_05045, partial [Treponemataceae bacterium]|nr:hypothetical protein [Treponemataceae bacterium]